MLQAYLKMRVCAFVVLLIGGGCFADDISTRPLFNPNPPGPLNPTPAPVFTVDLSLPPADRWTGPVSDFISAQVEAIPPLHPHNSLPPPHTCGRVLPTTTRTTHVHPSYTHTLTYDPQVTHTHTHSHTHTHTHTRMPPQHAGLRGHVWCLCRLSGRSGRTGVGIEARTSFEPGP